MLTVVTNPPDASHRLEFGAARTGGNFLTTAFGAYFRLYRRRTVFNILPFFFYVRHFQPPLLLAFSIS